MESQTSDSPVQLILSQDQLLALTAEQRKRLALIEIEWQRECIRTLSQRRLLELDAREGSIGHAASKGLTTERLTEIDALTVKLRQTWLQAWERAGAVLSADQREKVHFDERELPGFGFDHFPSEDNGVALDARISNAVAARLKDAKVVEIETAQAIAERLFGWAKSAAMVAGIPLALLAVVLSILGVSSWKDFTGRVEKGKQEIEKQLNEAKTSATEFNNQASALKNQFADLQRQYGDLSALASNVQGLSRQVQRLEEELHFNKSTELTDDLQQQMKQHLIDYRKYLQSLGYDPPSNLTASGNCPL